MQPFLQNAKKHYAASFPLHPYFSWMPRQVLLLAVFCLVCPWPWAWFFSCSSRFTTWFSACLLFGRCGFFFGLCFALCFALCFGLGGGSFAIGLCFSFSLDTKLASFWYLRFRRFRAFYRLRRFRTFIGFRTRRELGVASLEHQGSTQ